MALYRYVKSTSTATHIPRPFILSVLFMILGGGILAWALSPIIGFLVFTAPLFSTVISPLPDTITESRIAPKVLAAQPADEGESRVDFTNANIWFPSLPQKKSATKIGSYTLSIPKLKIYQATVIIAGDDLNKSLIHYGGTALPGEYGNTVIFGHSILPQFYSPKDYRAIFSTLPTLVLGDEVFIEYDEVRYRYVIFESTLTKPGDLSPLEQRFDDSFITLITCAPPGTYLLRLNVKARLQSI